MLVILLTHSVRHFQELPFKSISSKLIHSEVLNALRSSWGIFLSITFSVVNLIISANSGNFVKPKFEHSKMFSKQRHSYPQMFCVA